MVRGVITAYSYDSLKRLTSTTQDFGGIEPNSHNALTQYGYDVQDNLTFVKDPGNGDTTYIYDDFGNLSSVASQDTGVVVLHYDSAGNITSRIDANGKQVTYAYDALNRLILVDTVGTTEDVSYIYDNCTNGEGHLCSIMKSNMTVNYAYNGFGEVTLHQGMRYQYDTAGRLQNMTFPSGNSVTYIYNIVGKIERVDAVIAGKNTTLASNIKHAPFGPLRSMTYGNGANLMQTYDLAYRMLGQTTAGIYVVNYTSYDGNGNILTLDDLLTGTQQLFSYDALERMIDATFSSLSLAVYSYDKNGNRISDYINGVLNEYTYESNSSRMLTSSNYNITLDANGNTIEDGKNVYRYNSNNHLISVNLDKTIYRYNGLGQRISKETGAAGPDYAALASEEQARADAYNLEISSLQQNLSRLLSTLSTLELEKVGLLNQLDTTQIEHDALQDEIDDVQKLLTAERQLAADYQAASDFYQSIIIVPATDLWQQFLNYLYFLAAELFQYLADIVTEKINELAKQVNALQEQISGLDFTITSIESRIADMDLELQEVKTQISEGQSRIDLLSIQEANAIAKAAEYASLASNPSTTRIVYDYAYDLQGRLIYEARNGSVDAEYIYLNEQPLAIVRQGNVYYVHTDHLGTPRVITDNNQTTVWRWENSSPFGANVANEDPDQDGTSFTFNLRFPGQYYDAETGLHYNYFRYYDPSTGRYITADKRDVLGYVNDPQLTMQGFTSQGWFEFNGKMYYDGQAGSLNHLYGYANQNPTNWIDLYGLAPGQGGKGRSRSAPSGSGSIGDQMSDPNGNVFPGNKPQDGKCSVPIIGGCMDKNPDILERCKKHDQCFNDNKCNWSSWISSAMGGTKSCNECNSDF